MRKKIEQRAEEPRRVFWASQRRCVDKCKIGYVIVFCCMLCSCVQKPSGSMKKKQRSWRRASMPKPVHAVQVRQGPIAWSMSATTALSAEKKVKILARVEGLVRGISAREGRLFRKKNVLAVLHNPQIDLSKKKSRLHVKKLSFDLKRQRRLLQKGFVSQETADELTFRLAQATNDLRRMEQNAKDLFIRTTISGIVTEKRVNEGDWVSPNRHLFTIEDPRSLVAKIAIPEKYFSHLKLGLDAFLFAEALGRKVEIRGKVIRIAPTIDEKSGTIVVVIGDLSPQKYLKSGMFVSVKLILSRRENVALLPKQAILYDNNQPAVYRLIDDVGMCRMASIKKRRPFSRSALRTKRPLREGQAKGQGCGVEKIFFQKGIEEGRWVEILDGLNVGDFIVSLGQEELHAKSRVTIGKLRE